MTRNFCDLCETEIKSEYSSWVSVTLDAGVKRTWQCCKECGVEARKQVLALVRKRV